jgi:hypothetical protein
MSNVGFVIDFKPTGEVEAMHNDKFDLGFLGRKSVERATDIRFFQSSQQWDIYVPKPWPHVGGEFQHVRGAEGFATYEGARQVEVAWLNSCRRDGVEPTSAAGLELLRQIRSTLGL